MVIRDSQGEVATQGFQDSPVYQVLAEILDTREFQDILGLVVSRVYQDLVEYQALVGFQDLADIVVSRVSRDIRAFLEHRVTPESRE